MTDTPSTSRIFTVAKCFVAGVILYSANVVRQQEPSSAGTGVTSPVVAEMDENAANALHGRRLSMLEVSPPRYMEPLMTDLRERNKLFDETPPEEVKYWFEYTGPLQVRKRVWNVKTMTCLFCFLDVWD